MKVGDHGQGVDVAHVAHGLSGDDDGSCYRVRRMMMHDVADDDAGEHRECGGDADNAVAADGSGVFDHGW